MFVYLFGGACGSHIGFAVFLFVLVQSLLMPEKENATIVANNTKYILYTKFRIGETEDGR